MKYLVLNNNINTNEVIQGNGITHDNIHLNLCDYRYCFGGSTGARAIPPYFSSK